MPKKNAVALIDSDEDEAGDNNFNVNHAYADRYDNWRRLEEMQKFKDRYGKDAELSDSGDSSSSEEPAEWSTEQEKDFLKTLSALKSKDPKIYNEQARFFHEPQTPPEPTSDKKSKKTKEKPMFLKDYERELVVKHGGDISDEGDDDDQPGPSMEPGYYDKQNALKNEIKSALLDSDDDEGELLTKRVKTEAHQKQEDEDYYEWLKGQKESPDSEDKKALKPLKDIWSNPNLDADERFLRDYLLNKRHETAESNDVPTYEEIVNDPETLEEDEEELERERDFERKYNFRFEEPDQEFIKQYPRTVKESLRRGDDRRKQKRESYKERKDQEKQQKRDEIKQMKTMKRKEIEEKLKKLKAISGDDALPVNIDDLEGDFDPAEYDRRMQKMFDDQYYSHGVEDEEKPQFSDSDDDEDLPDYDDFPIGTSAVVVAADETEQKEESPAESGEEVAKTAPTGSKRKRKRKRNSKFAEAVSREKPRFDPSEKTFEEYFNEYYKLDYEDVIGDTTTRFKYRSVPQNDFGLSVEEILNADDRQLNAWATLKKATQYRSEKEEQYDIQAYKKKAQDVAKKQRIFTRDFGSKKKKSSQNEESAAVDADEHSASEANTTAETSKSQKKKNKKKKNKASTDGATETPTSANGSAPEAQLPEKKERPKARRRNKKKPTPLDAVSDDRLRAYGVNPNKFRNKHARKQQNANV